MKHELDENSYNHYAYTYNEYKYLYEEKLSKATKYKTIAIEGLWLIGGGIVLIVAENIMEKAVLSSGKAKIRKAVNLYNNGRMYSQSDIELDYGITCNGLYLSLSF